MSGVVKVMPLGDSITSSCCYRDMLYAGLRNAGLSVDFVGSVKGSAPAGQDWDQEGHGGYLVSDVLKAAGTGAPKGSGYYADVRDLTTWFGAQADRPDIVLMHLGTNDRWGGIAPTRILAGYSAVLAAVRAKNPNVIVLVAQIIPMNVGVDVRPLNDAIPAWAQTNSTANSRIIVVDQFTGFSSAWTSDGVHPTQSTGSQWLANRWLSALTPLLR